MFASSCLRLCLALGLLLLPPRVQALRLRLRPSSSTSTASTQLRARSPGTADELKITTTLAPLNDGLKPSLAVGGPINSIDIYCCQPGTCDLTIGQISAFAAMENRALQGSYTHSLILASLCRTRVVHLTGWSLQGMDLFYTFEDFKRRADSPSGTPAALKESTHLYKTIGQYPPSAHVPFTPKDLSKWPLFTIDIFTTKRADGQEAVVQALRASLEAVAAGPAPKELKTMHLLRSTDPLAAAVVSTWRPAPGQESGSEGGSGSEFEGAAAGPAKLRENRCVVYAPISIFIPYA